ncbi:MAG: putative transrane protein [Rhizobium sp.]|nr:putative transrane protein [Rhizobium sp.]
MKTILVAYVATLVVFVAVDFIWLSTMANVLYKPTMGDMLAPDFRLVPAVLFYLIYAAGLTFFAVRPSLQSLDLLIALFYGAAFGLVAYATYDLTNQATLKNWSTTLTIADIAWGALLSAIAAASGSWITQRFAA